MAYKTKSKKVEKRHTNHSCFETMVKNNEFIKVPQGTTYFSEDGTTMITNSGGVIRYYLEISGEEHKLEIV